MVCLWLVSTIGTYGTNKPYASDGMFERMTLVASIIGLLWSELRYRALIARSSLT